MSKEKENNKPLIKELVSLKKNIIYLFDNPDKLNKSSKGEIIQKIDIILEALNGLKRVLNVLLIAAIASTSLFIISLFYIDRIESENDTLSRINNDSTLIKIMAKDSTEIRKTLAEMSYSYFTRNDSIISYHQLYYENDELIDSIFKLNVRISELKHDKLKLKHEVKLNEDLLKGIKDNYGAYWKYDKKSRTYTLTGKKIDSALLLLEHYRNRIFYDDESKKWHVIIK